MERPEQREEVRAGVAARVLISESGQGAQATVGEHALLDRPARDSGERVRAYAVTSLSFDPPR